MPVTNDDLLLSGTAYGVSVLDYWSGLDKVVRHVENEFYELLRLPRGLVHLQVHDAKLLQSERVQTDVFRIWLVELKPTSEEERQMLD